MWTLAHSNLQKACIYLFPDPRDCRLLVTESGMDASQINFEEPPALRWQSVINEAEKQNTMGKLVPVLLSRYPENKQLQAACLPFEAAEPILAVPQKRRDAPAPIPPEAVLVKKFVKDDAPVDPSQSLDPISADEQAAIIASLRMVAAETERRLRELEDWRVRISTMSSANMGKGVSDE